MTLSILLIDDEEEILSLLQELLVARGFEVAVCADGDCALRTAQSKPFDVVLADLKMPGVRGTELIRSLKAAQPEAELIVTTGFGLKVKEELEGIGINDYLIKPIQFEELFARLAAIRERKMRPSTS